MSTTIQDRLAMDPMHKRLILEAEKQNLRNQTPHPNKKVDFDIVWADIKKGQYNLNTFDGVYGEELKKHKVAFSAKLLKIRERSESLRKEMIEAESRLKNLESETPMMSAFSFLGEITEAEFEAHKDDIAKTKEFIEDAKAGLQGLDWLLKRTNEAAKGFAIRMRPM